MLSLIYRHPSGGEIYQGGEEDLYSDSNNYDLIFFTAKEFLAKDFISHRPFRAINFPLDDKRHFSEDELIDLLSKVEIASNVAAASVRSGKKIAILCFKGLNRSGLVTSITLMKLTRCTPAQAIQLVRLRRSPAALFNDTFVSLINTYFE